MPTKTITVHIDDVATEVVLKSARKEDGIWRGELMTQAAVGGVQNARSMVAFYLYPTCVAAVKAPLEVRTMSLDDFIAKVDEADMDMWTEEAYGLNPQWKISMKVLAELSEEEAKKPGTPLTGSGSPTEDPKMQLEISPSLKS